MEVTPEVLEVQKYKVLLLDIKYYLPSHVEPHHFIVCSVLVAGDTRIANYIPGTKRMLFFNIAQLTENMVSKIHLACLLGIHQCILKIH